MSRFNLRLEVETPRYLTLSDTDLTTSMTDAEILEMAEEEADSFIGNNTSVYIDNKDDLLAWAHGVIAEMKAEEEAEP